jgi:phospholipid/cholesterol/gamma-HCH transport system permease protein
LHHLLGFVALVGHILIGLGGVLRSPRSLAPARDLGQFLQGGARHAGDGTGRFSDRRGDVLPVRAAVAGFGADAFIVNILGLGIIRELGPVLVSVLVAGRSGSAMTAQLGVMRVTEESTP